MYGSPALFQHFSSYEITVNRWSLAEISLQVQFQRNTPKKRTFRVSNLCLACPQTLSQGMNNRESNRLQVLFFICLFVSLCLFGKGSGKPGGADSGSSHVHNEDQAFYSNLIIWMSCWFQQWLLNNVYARNVGTWNARVTGDQIEFIQHVMSAHGKARLDWTLDWTGLDWTGPDWTFFRGG